MVNSISSMSTSSVQSTSTGSISDEEKRKKLKKKAFSHLTIMILLKQIQHPLQLLKIQLNQQLAHI